MPHRLTLLLLTLLLLTLLLLMVFLLKVGLLTLLLQSKCFTWLIISYTLSFSLSCCPLLLSPSLFLSLSLSLSIYIYILSTEFLALVVLSPASHTLSLSLVARFCSLAHLLFLLSSSLILSHFHSHYCSIIFNWLSCSCRPSDCFSRALSLSLSLSFTLLFSLSPLLSALPHSYSPTELLLSINSIDSIDCFAHLRSLTCCPITLSLTYTLTFFHCCVIDWLAGSDTW